MIHIGSDEVRSNERKPDELRSKDQRKRRSTDGSSSERNPDELRLNEKRSNGVR